MNENRQDPTLLPEGEEHILLATPPEHELLADPHELLLDTPKEEVLVPVSPPEQSPEISQLPSVEPIQGALEDDTTLFDTVGTGPVPEIHTEVLQDTIQETVDVSEVAVPNIQESPSESSESSSIARRATEEKTPSKEDPLPLPLPPTPGEPIIHQETAHIAPRSHKTLWIILIILGLLGAASAGAFFLLGGKGLNVLDHSYTVSPLPEPTSYTGDIQAMQNAQQHNTELLNQAIEKGNALYCEQITTPEGKLECQESVQAVSLSASGTVAQCQALTLTDIRDRCLGSVAQREALGTKNKILCSNISDTTQAQSCREAVDVLIVNQLIEDRTATPEICQALEPISQTPCMAAIKERDNTAILSQAITTDNLELCQELSTEDLRYTCFDTILMKRALTNGDTTVCDYIRDDVKKATCKNQTSTRDDNTAFRDAVTEKNLIACTTIQNTGLKERCHDSVTLLLVRDTKDASLCDTLISTGALAVCKKSVSQ